MKEGNERLTVWIDPSIKYHAKIKALTDDVTLSAVVQYYLKRYTSERILAEVIRGGKNGKSK